MSGYVVRSASSAPVAPAIASTVALAASSTGTELAIFFALAENVSAPPRREDTMVTIHCAPFGAQRWTRPNET